MNDVKITDVRIIVQGGDLYLTPTHKYMPLEIPAWAVAALREHFAAEQKCEHGIPFIDLCIAAQHAAEQPAMCAWCDNPAIGSAKSPSDDKRYPSCGCAGVEGTFNHAGALVPATPTPSTEQAPVVTLCGSTKFKDAINAENSRLTQEGNVVISLGLFGHTDLPDYNWDTDATDLKTKLDRLHFQKIRMADRVHVVNVGGYYGESTAREIAYARSIGKPVTFMVEAALVSPVSEQPTTDAESERRRQMDRDYWAGKWCGECRYGVVEDPPCCTQPEQPTPLDPEPWEHDCGFCGDDHSLAFDAGHPDLACCAWKPGPEFEQERARYEQEGKQ